MCTGGASGQHAQAAKAARQDFETAEPVPKGMEAKSKNVLKLSDRSTRTDGRHLKASDGSELYCA